MIYDNLFFLVYRGGRCGEFFGNLLYQHSGVYSPGTEYEPTINKYRTHDPVPNLVCNGANVSDKERTILEKILKANKFIARVHKHIDYQNLFPGSKVIVLSDNIHKIFFSNLYAAKFERYQTPILSVEEKFNPENRSDQFQYTKDCLYLDIDRLFFNSDQSIYYQLCDFIGIDPLDSAWLDILEYHKKNILLLESLGIDPYQTNATKEKHIEDYIKIIETAKNIKDYRYEKTTK